MYAGQFYSGTTPPQQVMPLMLLTAPDLHNDTYLQRLHAADNLPITASSHQTSLNSTTTFSYAHVHPGCFVAWSSKQTNSMLASPVLVDAFQLHYLCSHPWVAEGLLGTQ